MIDAAFQSGTGVSVYVVDTGIRFSHKEFLSLDGTRTRAIRGWAFDGSDGSDCHGHGTHTAATIGGLSYGVAKDVTLVSVKAMGCNGLSTYDNLVKVCILHAHDSSVLQGVTSTFVKRVCLFETSSGCVFFSFNIFVNYFNIDINHQAINLIFMWHRHWTGYPKTQRPLL